MKRKRKGGVIVKVRLHPVRTALLGALAGLAWLVYAEPGTALLLLGALDVEML